ncbi:tetratricopeptide repeat protein [Caulobacter soli]|uniref:tetratricopeptide repeat protein n=1 Tax=Caulobacter soli TaxID=2708539 RepID=UPI0013EB9590|nr:tetratricopeptide repeat protein [Caulobacter soli]
MMARLVGIILGVILATSGYVIAGLGVLGDWAQNLDLGPFEPHRPFVGWAAAITGAVLLVAALTPRFKRKTKRKIAPVDLGADLPGELVAAPILAVEPVSAAEPEPRPEPVAIPIVAAEHAPPPAPVETFEDLRARLVTLSRQDAWSEAAQTLNRLLRMARDDREKAVSRRDLGDFARGQGRLDEAAEAYEEAVSYARAVRDAGPQGDFAADDLLASALSGVGDVAEMEGRLNDALSAFEEALALRRSHGGREAADPNARRALSVSLERLADLREDRGHRMRALDLYRESYDVAARLAAADPSRFGADLASTRARLSELEAKIAG